MLKSAAAGNIILVLLVSNPKMKSGPWGPHNWSREKILNQEFLISFSIYVGLNNLLVKSWNQPFPTSNFLYYRNTSELLNKTFYGCLSNVFGLKLQSGNHEKYLFNNGFFQKIWKNISHFLAVFTSKLNWKTT